MFSAKNFQEQKQNRNSKQAWRGSLVDRPVRQAYTYTQVHTPLQGNQNWVYNSAVNSEHSSHM